MRGPHSDETRTKISRANRGRQLSEEHKIKIGEALKGRTRPPEVGEKISAALVGRKHSQECRAKMSEARKGKVPLAAVAASYARIHPPGCFHCERVRVANSARALSPDERHSRRKQSTRASILRTRYGITVDVYDAMLESQGGVCAICRNTCATGKRLSVDHDHTTGQVRGLLCQRCNRGIGHFDSPEIILAAAKYVEQALDNQPSRMVELESASGGSCAPEGNESVQSRL